MTAFDLLGSIILYIGLLVVVAWLGQRPGSMLRKLADTPFIYVLSVTVYCTSWTYYGSVGKAANSGYSFLAVYLGPTLALLVAGPMMRRILNLKNSLHIASIADFLGARYFRSQQVATLVTIMCVVGAIPYISLQLKAVTASLQVLIDNPATSIPATVRDQIPMLVTLGLTVFTILFGVRRLDPTDRHPGIIVALALECLIKLVAFIAVGVFVCFVLYSSPWEMLTLAKQPEHAVTQNLGKTPEFFNWLTLMALSASAFFFLPRQFHTAIVENGNPEHYKTVQWGFPLYVLLINLFVIPIALAGLLLGYAPNQADSFVLMIPLNHGEPFLALLAFIGGLSAAMGMVMICSMTLSTMVVNHIALPIIDHVPGFARFRGMLLQLRWAAVAVVILFSDWFNQAVGGSYMLVNIGLISFAAIIQLAPATIAGVFWPKGTKKGALMGLIGGFVVWAYCLILPTFVKSDWVAASLLTDGPAGIGWLNPEALFYLSGVDSLSHGVFWSLSVNIVLFVFGSLWDRTQEDERQYYQQFMDDMKQSDKEDFVEKKAEASIALPPRRERLIGMLREYLPDREALTLMHQAEEYAKTSSLSLCNLFALAELGRQIDQRLSGVLGASSASKALQRIELITTEERQELANHYSAVLAELQISPAELKRKVDFYEERQQMIIDHSNQQAETIKELESEIERRHEAEQAKERARRQQQLIMDFAPAVIYMVDPQGNLLEANNSLLSINQIRAEDAIGKPVNQLLPQAQVDVILEHHEVVFESMKTMEFVEYLHPNPEFSYVSVKFPIVDDGTLIGLCSISTDITERERMQAELKAFSQELENKVALRTQELQTANVSLKDTLDDLQSTQSRLVEAEKMSALAALITGVAHEINTPLGVAVTANSGLNDEMTQLIDAVSQGKANRKVFDDFTEHTADYLVMLKDNLNRVVLLVNTFKSLTAYENDTLLTQTDLRGMLNDFQQKQQEKVKNAGHQLIINCPDNLSLETYPKSLEQGLTYLLDNSLKHAFADMDHGTITVSAHMQGDHIELHYEDNGCGLTEEIKTHLFDPFVTSKRHAGSVGLGGHILYILVTQKLNGEIKIDEDHPQGLKLILTLPVAHK